jgi:hypothetical protein
MTTLLRRLARQRRLLRKRELHEYNMLQHDTVINMMLDDAMPRLRLEYNFPSRYSRKIVKPLTNSDNLSDTSVSYQPCY